MGSFPDRCWATPPATSRRTYEDTVLPRMNSDLVDTDFDVICASVEEFKRSS
jgi:hypothetical protein